MERQQITVQVQDVQTFFLEKKAGSSDQETLTTGDTQLSFHPAEQIQIVFIRNLAHPPL